MVDITSKNFEAEVAQNAIPAIVLWGGKTNVLSNSFAYSLSKFTKIASRPFKLCRIDLTDSPDLAMQFSIRNEPYLMLFVAGMGMVANADLQEFLKGIKPWTD